MILIKKKTFSIKKKFPKLKIFKNENEIFNDKKVNLVSIASYDEYHFKQITKCFKNKKNFIIEKPICTTKIELEKFRRLAKKNKKIKFIYSNFYYYYENKKIKKVFSNNLLPEGKITQDLLNNYKVGILTVMIKKDLFKKKKFNSKLKIIGDFDFFIKLSVKEKFHCVQKPLAYYRVHNSNFSKNFNIHSNEMNKWIIRNSNYFIKKNYSLNKLHFLNTKLKIKNLFRLGP